MVIVSINMDIVVKDEKYCGNAIIKNMVFMKVNHQRKKKKSMDLVLVIVQKMFYIINISRIVIYIYVYNCIIYK